MDQGLSTNQSQCVRLGISRGTLEIVPHIKKKLLLKQSETEHVFIAFGNVQTLRMQLKMHLG